LTTSLASLDSEFQKKYHGTCGQVPIDDETVKLPHQYKRTVEHVWKGIKVRNHSIPWIVSLRNATGHWCGGSVLRVNSKDESDIIVTAAHCVDTGKIKKIHLGAHYRSKLVKDEVAVTPVHYIVHPKIYPIGYPDIAIVKLERPIRFSKAIQPVCLPGKNDDKPAGTNLTVAGWGFMEDMNYSEILRKVDVPLIDSEACQISYKNCAYICPQQIYPKAMLCAGGKEGKDACHQDSGGPLYFKEDRGNVMYGVVSFGPRCKDHKTPGHPPGVYVRVSTYVDWIQEQIRNLTSVKE